MAGAGYKLFNTGDVLTAAQVNTYLMQQTVMVFADASARTTALSGVLAEGMLSYLQDTNSTEVYNGSAWVALAADQTPLTTKGDLFTYTTADARLASSNVNGDVLTVDTSTATGLKWAAPAPASAGQDWVLLNSGGTSLSGSSSVTVSGISGKNNIIMFIKNSALASDSTQYIRLNGDSGTNYYATGCEIRPSSTYSASMMDDFSFPTTGDTDINIGYGSNAVGSSGGSGWFSLTGGNSSGKKIFNSCVAFNSAGGSGQTTRWQSGYYDSSSTISSITIRSSSNFNGGTIWVYTSTN